MIIIGIDPGKAGGIASSIEGCADWETFAVKIPATERDIANTIGGEVESHPSHDAFAYIEKVHSSPQMGVKSSFTFGQGYGFLRGVLISHQIPFEEVRPQVWQKAMGCLSKGDKNVTKAKAQQLFPHLKVTHAIADALLICEYGRRLRCQSPTQTT